jgi:hypothetical protein
MAAKFRFEPCPECCEEQPPSCAGCIEGTAPNQFQVTISGLGDGWMCKCSELNGTFIVDYNPYDDKCRWTYSAPSSECDTPPHTPTLEVMYYGFSQFFVRWVDSIDYSIVMWQWSVSEPIDCDLDADVPFFSQDSRKCTGTPTCHLTAL